MPDAGIMEASRLKMFCREFSGNLQPGLIWGPCQVADGGDLGCKL
jgi:hypothetical protein